MAYTVLSLIVALAANASAQNLRATLAAPALPVVRVAPVLPVAAPTLAAPTLSLSAPVLAPAFAAPRLTPVAAAAAAPIAVPAAAQAQAHAAPALEALAAPAPSAASAHAAGITLEDALTGRRSYGAVFAAPAAPVNGALPTARSAPAVSGVSYARGIEKRHKDYLNESLRRRKAGWFRGLARMGVTLEGPTAPKLKVTAAKDRSSKVMAVVTAVEYTVSWTQGPMKSGSFRVVVPMKDPEPELSRLAAPAIPAEKQVVLRVKSGTPEAEARAFFEAQGLRVVNRSYDGLWTVAVTGRQGAAAAARRLSGKGFVIHAAAKNAVFAEADQVLVSAKAGITEDALAALFSRHGLVVIEKRRDGLWRAAAAKGKSAKTLSALGQDDAVFFARPLVLEAPETRMAVVTLRPGSDAQAASAFFKRHGLTVVDELGEQTYKVAGSLDAAALAALLAKDEAVAQTVAVGSLSDAEIESAARGAASYKGRPWSSTEYSYNWALTQSWLVRRGATAAQLALFEKLTSEAPVKNGGFNPWSGD